MIAAELRLGNWVNTIVSDKPSIVTFIKSQKVKDGYYQSIELNEEEIYIPQHICGIPLTADILERAGFEKANAYKGVYLFNNMAIDTNGWKLFGYSKSHEKKLEYVHELQNLYHALTGEELTINMNQ